MEEPRHLCGRVARCVCVRVCGCSKNSCFDEVVVLGALLDDAGYGHSALTRSDLQQRGNYE